jgi:hypothetical protein
MEDISLEAMGIMERRWSVWDRGTGRELGKYEGDLESVIEQLEAAGIDTCYVGLENEFYEWCREYGA